MRCTLPVFLHREDVRQGLKKVPRTFSPYREILTAIVLMISGDWLNFAIMILVQFNFFFVCALYYKKLSEVPFLLLHGIIIGIVVGLVLILIRLG